MDAQRPAQNGRTEACPEWAHEGLPRVGAAGPTHNEFTLPLVNPRLEPIWPESGVLNMHI